MIVCRLRILAWSHPPRAAQTPKREVEKHRNRILPSSEFRGNRGEETSEPHLTFLGGGILSRFGGWDTKFESVFANVSRFRVSHPLLLGWYPTHFGVPKHANLTSVFGVSPPPFLVFVQPWGGVAPCTDLKQASYNYTWALLWYLSTHVRVCQ